MKVGDKSGVEVKYYRIQSEVRSTSPSSSLSSAYDVTSEATIEIRGYVEPKRLMCAKAWLIAKLDSERGIQVV